MSLAETQLDNAAVPSLLRRLAAIFYDCWLVAALWLLGTIVDTFIRAGMGIESGHGSFLLLQIYFVVAPALFFSWFWTHGGQTLGMRAWRLKVVADDGQTLTMKQALIRYLGACLSLLAAGLGYLWVLIDKQGLAWHDHLSRTRLVIIKRDQ
ncbi:RDD family protein [Thiosocius teredinicola]|uniref:RDD family protein n=1 Tax=Thiosocius teredinicola TaxID=1973002 RepID=UPI000991456E